MLIPFGTAATVQPLWSRQYLDFLGQWVSKDEPCWPTLPVLQVAQDACFHRRSDAEMTNLREQANRESVLLSQLVRCILAANNKQTGITSLFRRLTTSRPTPTPGPEYPGV